MHILHETYEFAHIKQHVYYRYVFLEIYAHLMKHHNEQKKSPFKI